LLCACLAAISATWDIPAVTAPAPWTVSTAALAGWWLPPDIVIVMHALQPDCSQYCCSMVIKTAAEIAITGSMNKAERLAQIK
jgi:hypothetical protein